jgi:uncharacterized membrane protein
MEITKGEIAVFAIALAAFIVGTCFYPYLPERMASHWNARGEVDDYMSKAWGAFLMPIVILGLGLLFMVTVRIDPLKANIAKFRKYYDGFIILLPVFMLCLHVWMLLWNVGYKFSLNIVMPIGIGLLIFYLGILCENVKRNWFIGIRTPWTLRSDIVWTRTHKVGARLFKAAGIVILAGAFWPAYLLWFILIPTILVTIFLIVYSYVVYQKVGEIGESAGRLNDESENGTWETVKAGYLEQVEKALASVGHREKKQVLEDVSSHLNQRFSELGDDEQTWENMQAIITEMGPASDYAELLEPATPKSNKEKVFASVIIIVAVIAVAIIFAPHLIVKYTEIVSDRIEDNIDAPFADDPEVVGKWTSVDFVDSIDEFNPTVKRWMGGELFLHELVFYANGKLTAKNEKVKRGYTLKWTKGIIISSHEKTASKYHIKEIDGEKYMFYEWKSGDYTIRHQKPSYYVLKKEPVETDIAIEDIRIHPYREGGLYSVTVSIRNKAEGVSPKFGVYFYQGDPSDVKPMTHGAGPIEPGDGWNERSMPFALKEGTNQIIAIIDPDDSVAESDENNNRAWIRLIVNEGRITNKTTGFGKSRMGKQPPEDGINSARAWLALIDDGDYGASWEEAADIFKNAATKEQWENMAKTVRQPLGKVVSRQVMSKIPTRTVPGGPDGEYVIIQFKTSFENKADAIETVTPMLDEDVVWRVTGYYIK